MDGLPAALSVFGPDGQIGTLYPTDPLSFDYCEAWLNSPNALPLHPAIPLATGRVDSAFVAAFFENLLPEGDQRKLISMREQVSTVYGLRHQSGLNYTQDARPAHRPGTVSGRRLRDYSGIGCFTRS